VFSSCLHTLGPNEVHNSPRILSTSSVTSVAKAGSLQSLVRPCRRRRRRASKSVNLEHAGGLNTESHPAVSSTSLCGIPCADHPETMFSFNLHAPEFIPTMSMVCPLVGICTFSSTSSFDMSQDCSSDINFVGVQALCAREDHGVVSLAPPTGDGLDGDEHNREGVERYNICSPRLNQSEVGESLSAIYGSAVSDVGEESDLHHFFIGTPRARTGDGGLNDYGDLKCPDRRRLLPRKSLAVDIPERRASRRCNARNGEGDLIDRLEPRDLPEASDETWEHRIQTRHRNLQLGKSTREYQKFLEARDHFKDHHDIMEPLTPNPFDRSVSKRSWKYQVMQWRLALQDWYLENSVSVASTTECSNSTAATEGESCTTPGEDDTLF